MIGRVHMDYITHLDITNFLSIPLDAIGEYELGETKVAYTGTLDQLYNNDFEKFIAYNRQDTLLLGNLDKKLKFIDLSNELVPANTVLLATTMGAVAVTEQAITTKHMNVAL